MAYPLLSSRIQQQLPPPPPSLQQLRLHNRHSQHHHHHHHHYHGTPHPTQSFAVHQRHDDDNVVNMIDPDTYYYYDYIPSMITFQNVSQQYPRTILRQLFSSIPDREYAIQNISFALVKEPSFSLSSSSSLPPRLSMNMTKLNEYNSNDLTPHSNNNNYHYNDYDRFLILTGASSSGKSTILQMIIAQHHQKKPPTHGTVTIRTSTSSSSSTFITNHHTIGDVCNNHNNNNNNSQYYDDDDVVAKPILMDTITISQYRLQYESRRTISNILQDDIISLTQHSLNFKSQSSSNTRSASTVQGILRTTVVHDLVRLVQLFPTLDNDNLQLLQLEANMATTTPSQLSTSQQYKFAILRACLRSSCCNIRFVGCDSLSNDTTTTTTTASFILPGPILLLDECLDHETTTTIQNIQSILITLCTNMGAIVIVTTHVPQRWQQSPLKSQVMKLCRGEILTTTTTTTTF